MSEVIAIIIYAISWLALYKFGTRSNSHESYRV